jgi:hypothetical protein
MSHRIKRLLRLRFSCAIPVLPACRLGRSRPPRRARDPGSRRTARLRPPRHVRPLLRRDLSSRRSLSHHREATRQQRTLPHPGSAHGNQHRSHPPARSCRRIPRRITRRRLRRPSHTTRPRRSPSLHHRKRKILEIEAVATPIASAISSLPYSATDKPTGDSSRECSFS